MAVSNVLTFGLLNAWPRIMHEDIWRFNQIAGKGVRVAPNCTDASYIQFERDSIANALYTAFNQMADYLGYFPSPAWVTDEIITIRSNNAWHAQTLTTRQGHVEAFGKRVVSAIASNVNVAYSDEDFDTVLETAKVTVTTTVADDEIQAFFRVADGAEGTAHEYWRIEPLTVLDNGDGTKTLTGHRALFAHPLAVWAKEYAAPEWTTKFQGDTQNNGHFVTQVDVYRVYADPMDAVQLLSNPELTDTPVTSATAWLKDTYNGDFSLYTDDAQTSPDVTPREVKVSYKAGHPLLSGRMERRLELALVRYANTFLPLKLGFCDRAKIMWEEDRKVGEDLPAGAAWDPPPFGITNGGIYAWSVVDAMRNPLKGKRVYSKRASGSG